MPYSITNYYELDAGLIVLTILKLNSACKMNPRSFSVASFNVLNLLHPGVHFAGRDEQPYTQDLYEKKLDWIVRILLVTRPALVGLQELFSSEALAEIARRAGYKYMYAPDIEEGKNILLTSAGRREAKGPYNGLLSMFPITASSSIEEFPSSVSAMQIFEGNSPPNDLLLPVTSFQRPVLQVDVELKTDITTTVFVAHLKSKRPLYLSKEMARRDDPSVQACAKARSLIVRAAESVALRNLLASAMKGSSKPVLLFGDLNDDLSSVTTQIVAGDEPYRFLKSESKKDIRDTLLYSVHDIEEQESFRDVSYTHIFNGRYELLDHIFVSQEFYHRNPSRIATVRSTRIFNDHLRDDRRALSPARGLSSASDHGIPVTEIEWLASDNA